MVLSVSKLVCSDYCLGCIEASTNCTSCYVDEQRRELVGSECLCIKRSSTEPLSYYETPEKDLMCLCAFSLINSLPLQLLHL